MSAEDENWRGTHAKPLTTADPLEMGFENIDNLIPTSRIAELIRQLLREKS